MAEKVPQVVNTYGRESAVNNQQCRCMADERRRGPRLWRVLCGSGDREGVDIEERVRQLHGMLGLGGAP
jgi:hypothetical protein